MSFVQVDHANSKISPPVLLLIHLFVAFLLQWLLPLPFAFRDVLVWVGYTLVVIGLALPISAAIQFRKVGTTLDPYHPVRRIVTNGPCVFSRNPIYLGLVCFLIGFTFISRTYWGLILSPLFVLLITMLVIKYEEAYLEQKFGPVYTSYKSRVRRWL